MERVHDQRIGHLFENQFLNELALWCGKFQTSTIVIEANRLGSRSHAVTTNKPSQPQLIKNPNHKQFLSRLTASQ